MITRAALTGGLAEWVATLWVWAHGLRIIKRNYRQHAGEIDVIATRQDLLVFIEVRLRSNDAFGNALSSVDERKQRNIRLTAGRFLQRHPAYANHRCRFDVVAISRPNYFPRLQWIRNAFEYDHASIRPVSDDLYPTHRLRFLE